MELNATEKKILLLICKEKPNKEIASILYISKRMVDYHVTSILGKFNVATRVGAAVFALQNQIITSEEMNENV
ncbi:regulatory protein, luxR family [Paenibacillus algorifonticola]|uniref:Regulatory protein, luxR family n=1 Tax=Paenibacillus algorifonticola TaxID=684063 RepID=A0A1I2DWV7_9BACL|nr:MULTISPECIES: LuxR C-terminal-related transcriptional regulator [Paenibacillus]KQO15322.1 hypothetical protein ASF12_27920 [Paenibacillus sp. Leaf72]SFE84713.1 regulatory protein, luxR family [Paenibacillus algorifonticola]